MASSAADAASAGCFRQKSRAAHRLSRSASRRRNSSGWRWSKAPRDLASPLTHRRCRCCAVVSSPISRSRCQCPRPPAGQAGSADAADAGQGQQPGGGEQPLDLAQFLPPPDETGRLGRKAGLPRPGGPSPHGRRLLPGLVAGNTRGLPPGRVAGAGELEDGLDGGERDKGGFVDRPDHAGIRRFEQ